MRIYSEIYPPMLPTRPCEFCLSLQHGSVFADFDVDDSGCAFLVRISFDGYGCCLTQDNIQRMNADDSRSLLKMIDNQTIDAEECDRILRACFQENKHVIWEDALDDHSLL